MQANFHAKTLRVIAWKFASKLPLGWQSALRNSLDKFTSECVPKDSTMCYPRPRGYITYSVEFLRVIPSSNRFSTLKNVCVLRPDPLVDLLQRDHHTALYRPHPRHGCDCGVESNGDDEAVRKSFGENTENSLNAPTPSNTNRSF